MRLYTELSKTRNYRRELIKSLDSSFFYIYFSVRVHIKIICTPRCCPELYIITYLNFVNFQTSQLTHYKQEKIVQINSSNKARFIALSDPIGYMRSIAIQCKQIPYITVLSIALYTAMLHFCSVH